MQSPSKLSNLDSASSRPSNINPASFRPPNLTLSTSSSIQPNLPGPRDQLSSVPQPLNLPPQASTPSLQPHPPSGIVQSKHVSGGLSNSQQGFPSSVNVRHAKSNPPVLQRVHGRTEPTYSESDQSSLHSIEKNLRNWKTAKTRSEEKYERRDDKVQKSMRNMDELNKKRVEHLKNLKREIKILEKIERKISKGETELEDTSVDNSEYSTTKVMESPTRKLTYIKGSARTRNDDTTVTDVFTVSRDAVDEGTTTRQLTKGLGNEDPRFDSSDKSSVLSLLTESSHRNEINVKIIIL